jgi:hypothetical protein
VVVDFRHEIDEDGTMSETPEQAKAAVDVIMAVAEAIRELKTVPSGHLYARLMGYMDLQTYNRIIDTLKRVGAVSEKNHVLTWVQK